MAKLAWMKFFPSDWIQDTRVLSPNAKGHWIDLICAMWVSPTRGRITWGTLELANFLGIGSDALAAMINHLSNVANIELYDAEGHRTKDSQKAVKVTVKSRRILREERLHHQALTRDRRYKRRRSDGETTKRLQTSDVRLKKKTKTSSSRAQPEADTTESVTIDGKEHGWPTPEALVALYNTEAAANLPEITIISPKRREKAKQYLIKFPKLDFWKEVFLETKKSTFLMGVNSGEGHRGFSGNLDWLLTTGKDGTENCVKTYEGRYRDKK